MKPGSPTGQAGELYAKKFLREKGYTVLTQNYRCPLGEVDLVCRQKETIVFVEVKTRTSDRFGTGAEAVTSKKRQKLVDLSLYYLKEKKMEERPIRFDVISILSGKEEDILHIENAFA